MSLLNKILQILFNPFDFGQVHILRQRSGWKTYHPTAASQQRLSRVLHPNHEIWQRRKGD